MMFLLLCSLQEGGDFLPVDENGKVLFSDVDYLETWGVSLFGYISGLDNGILSNKCIFCIKFKYLHVLLLKQLSLIAHLWSTNGNTCKDKSITTCINFTNRCLNSLS